MALDLDPYVKKLLNARRRVVLVNNILQNAQVSGKSFGVGLEAALINLFNNNYMKGVAWSDNPTQRQIFEKIF